MDNEDLQIALSDSGDKSYKVTIIDEKGNTYKPVRVIYRNDVEEVIVIIEEN